MSTISQAFKNHVLNCMEDVIFTTANDLSEAMTAVLHGRPHLETVRRALSILREEGLVESHSRPNGARGWKLVYTLARTKPIIGSLRKAA